MTVGTSEHPLRVAVIGSGPAAFYAVEQLFKQSAAVVDVDMFERLPAPHGLVRYGVAPDHAKIKTVTRAYDTIAGHDRFRFFGNVEYGRHVTLDDLSHHYHAVVFATGAQTDRHMGIPGERASALSDEECCEFVRTRLALVMAAAKDRLRTTGLNTSNVVIDEGHLGRKGAGDRRRVERRKGGDRRKADQPHKIPATGDRRRTQRRSKDRRAAGKKAD